MSGNQKTQTVAGACLLYLDEIIATKHGRNAPRYIIPAMKDIMMENYGRPVYQEQIMMVANKIAGFSLGEADIKEGYLWRQYYSFSQIDELVASVVKNRAWIKEKYHPDYEARMEECRLENEGKRGFWSKAVIV